MSDSTVEYKLFVIQVKPEVTEAWVFCESDFAPSHGWRHKTFSASVAVVDIFSEENFAPLEWATGAPPMRWLETR